MNNGLKEDADAYAGGAGNVNELSGYSQAVPQVTNRTGEIDPSLFAPMMGNLTSPTPAGAVQPEYLQYNPKSWVEQMFFNTGTSYLFGVASGGVYGAYNGLRTAPSRKFKIRVNSILNKSGRFGSRFGNALGAVAMMYSCVEATIDYAELDRYVGGDEFISPVLAGITTGIIYKSTHGTKTKVLAGIIGGAALAGMTGGRMLMNSGNWNSLFNH